MSEFDPSLDPQRYDAPLTPEQMALRDTFIQEYLKDHDAYAACLRIGFQVNFAIDMAKQLMGCGYVRRGLDYFTRKREVNPDEDKQAMLANLRELSFNGPPAVRASATKQYMEAMGYVKQDNTAEDAVAALIGALANFGENAPA